jgi:hypothetical protein
VIWQPGAQGLKNMEQLNFLITAFCLGAIAQGFLILFLFWIALKVIKFSGLKIELIRDPARAGHQKRK